MKLISLTEFKTNLQMSTSDDDNLLADILDGNSTRIIRLAGVGEKKVRTELHWAGGHYIWVKFTPVDLGQPFDLVELDEDGNETTFTATEFDVDLEEGRVTLKKREFIPQPFQSVKVTYTGGYATTGTGQDEVLLVDSDLKKACFMQSRYEFLNRDQLGLAGVSVAGASVSLAPAALLPEVKSIIQEFKKGNLYAG